MTLQVSSNCASLTHSLATHVVSIDKLPSPSELHLTGNVSDNWSKFRRKFEIDLEETRSAGKAERLKTSILIHVIWGEALKLYNTFTWDISHGSSDSQPIHGVQTMSFIDTMRRILYTYVKPDI